MTVTRFYYGTRGALKAGDLIEPASRAGAESLVSLTPVLDEAIWDAEIAGGDGPARVYVVEPTGPVEERTDRQSPRHPSMSWRSREPLRVAGEVTEWTLYHGTRADLKPGDLIAPGHVPNFGDRERTTRYVYLTRTLDAAAWGAELADGEAPGRIYIVEPTGPIEDDPNLTDRKFRGNPTKSFRSREPLRVTGEVRNWKGHAPEALEAMRKGLEQRNRLGAEIIEEIPEFGEAVPGATYVPRPGGYAVIFDGRGRLAVVATDEGLHLPGGGQEAGESPEAATIREVAEETGLEVALEGMIGVADELAFAPSRNVHYRKRCSFFRATVTGTGEPTETDHELRWIEAASALRELHHEVQRWAVRKALEALDSD